MTNFVRKVHPLVKSPSGRLHTYNMDTQAGIISNYFKSLGHVFPDEYDRADAVFFRTIGFGALVDVLPTFLDLTTAGAQKVRFMVADANRTFSTVADFDFGQWRGRSGSGVEKAAAEQLRTELIAASGDATGASIEV